MTNEQNKYDLEERTAIFGESVIKLCKSIKVTIYTEPIIKQIIRSATSVGANYMEANGASSKKDFCNKIYICKKEAEETKHWLRILASACDAATPRWYWFTPARAACRVTFTATFTAPCVAISLACERRLRL